MFVAWRSKITRMALSVMCSQLGRLSERGRTVGRLATQAACPLIRMFSWTECQFTVTAAYLQRQCKAFIYMYTHAHAHAHLAHKSLMSANSIHFKSTMNLYIAQA